MKPFFVLSSARSGSTSLCRILDSASNATCLSEPAPTLGAEAREIRDNRRADVAAIVRDVVGPRIEAVTDIGHIYGEKNTTLAPFVPELARQFDANFVHLIRDGRDVVTSLMNWHSHLFGSVYREANSRDTLSRAARAQAGELLAIDDESDYARHRPQSGSELAARWLELSRFEMCCWYWAEANRELRAMTAQLRVDQWARLNYTGTTSHEITGLASMFGLEGITADDVDALLAQRINSLRDRNVDADNTFPHWRDWPSTQRDAFHELAGAEMTELGLWDPAKPWASG